MRRYVLEDVQSEDRSENGMWFLVEIFYKHSVVGGVVNCIVMIYGGGTHSARRYRRDCEVIKLYRCIHAARNGDQFFIHRTEIFDFVVR